MHNYKTKHFNALLFGASIFAFSSGAFAQATPATVAAPQSADSAPSAQDVIIWALQPEPLGQAKGELGAD